MRQVKLTADLEIKNNAERITIQNDDQNVWINISSSSAVSFPLKTLLAFKKYIPKSIYLNQAITISFSDLKVIKIENGQMHYLEKWILLKFLLKTIFKKGL